MTEIVYATTATALLTEGRRFCNAQHFMKADKTATKVFVVGRFPRIVSAYEALGIPVEVVGAEPAKPLLPVAPQPRRETPLVPVTRPDAGSVDIPGDFRDLPWPQLRALAKQISEWPAINSREAVTIIEGELKRRDRWPA